MIPVRAPNQAPLAGAITPKTPGSFTAKGNSIHTQARAEDCDGQCLLVIIGVKPDGSKERVALSDGYRESKQSWIELLLDLKKRGLQAPPLLAAGDGAMGLWAALEEVFPQTRHQRCWFHYADLLIMPECSRNAAVLAVNAA